MYGVDYAFNPHPSVTALRNAGVKFVFRYVSNTPDNDRNGKNLLPAETQALLSAGISIGVVCEYYARRMLEGYDRGKADAAHADAVVKALGMPGLPIFFAADWDATPGDQTGINAYLDGAAAVIGRKRTGVYGSYYVCKRSLDAGKASYTWQTYAWSGGQWDSRVHVRQYQNGVTLGGASVDKDESRQVDFGQWPRPSVKFTGTFKSDGTLTLAEIASKMDHPASTILRHTAIHYGTFDAGLADYLNGLVAGTVEPTAPVPAGQRFWVD